MPVLVPEIEIGGGRTPDRRKSAKQSKKPALVEISGDRIRYGSLPSLLGYQIRQAQSAIFRDFALIMADLEVTPGEFGLLTLLEENPGISQVRLASAYKLDKSTLSLAISGLVRRGLVRRSRATQDQRVYALWLRERGRELLRKVRHRVDGEERAMNAVLRAGEREQLLDMLKRISRCFTG